MDHTRSRSTIERLPKASIQHLYREHVCPPRNEDKSDMVNVLWQRYTSGTDSKAAQLFWHHVRLEWEHVESKKRAVSEQPNRDGWVREFHPEQP